LIIGLNQISNAYSISDQPYQKRHFDKDFKDRYSGSKFNYEGNAVVKISPRGSGQYEDYKNEKLKKEKEDNNNYNISIPNISWIFYLALAFAVIYLAYILLNEGSSGLFSNSNKNARIINHDQISAENIENTDINALISSAEKNNDFRLAIRFYYLLVLKNLAIKNHIKFEEDKTNAEYLDEINDKPFSENFAYISYLYNYIWYGEFPLNLFQYEKAKSNFTILLKQVS